MLKVQSHKVKLGAEEAVIDLLAVTFTPNETARIPAGVVELVLAGGGAIRLTVECIEAELADLTQPWAARGTPDHEAPLGNGMARRLNAADASFAADFEKLLFAKREEEEDVAQVVRGIIADVRARGDAALVELTNRFDKAGVTAGNAEAVGAEIDAGAGKCK